MRHILLIVSLVGCQDTNLERLEGRWVGKIICYSFTSELSMTIAVDQKLAGKALIRAKENNTNWTIEGGFASSCLEDTCTSNKDCPRGFSSDAGDRGELRKCLVRETCKEQYQSCMAKTPQACSLCGNCMPCQLCEACDERWLPLKLVFHDQQVILVDPSFKLWPYGDVLLKGTIKGYCPDEQTIGPEVEVRKQ